MPTMTISATSDEFGLDALLSQDPVVRCGSLPCPPLTSFIGRQREMAEVKRLLATTRLLTLTGPGGCGKTRLALQVATELAQEFEHGVWWVELAALSDPRLLAQAVASVLGLGEQPDRSLTDLLADALRPKHLLLVLDNCEQVVAACARLAEVLLPACPNLRWLATSREALSMAGETAWLVPSLRLPDFHRLPPLEELRHAEAIQLFVERAAAVQPSFTLTQENAPAVAQICQRLDGIPLAIELAAARVKMLSLAQIAARLDDACRLLTGGNRTALSRQQTLRATLDWSYRLLAEKERTMFCRLSVFAGGFTLEAAEVVCAGEDVAEEELLDLLSRLINKSLVLVEERGSEVRYRMLETMRQYGQDKLQGVGAAASVRGRHRDWYLGLVERAEPELEGAQQAVWFDRLEVEHDNLRAALGWALEGGQAEEAARLGAPLWRFWLLRGHLSEGRSLLEAALAGVPEGTAVRAKALNAAGVLACQQNDYARARVLLEESLELWRSLENRPGRAYALYNLGTVAHARGDYEQATTYYKESVVLLRVLGERRGIALALNSLGMTVLCQGDAQRARGLCEQSLALFRDLGDSRSIASALTNLGLVALERGDAERARGLCEESLALRQQLGDKGGIAHTLTILGRIALSQGDAERATACYQKGLALRQELGDKQGMAACLLGLAGVALGLGQAARAARFSRAAQALGLAIGAPVPLASSTGSLHTGAPLRPPSNEATIAPVPTTEWAILLEQTMAEALAEPTPSPQPATHLPAAQTANGKVQPAVHLPPTGTAAANGKAQPELRLFALGPARVLRGKHALEPSDWTYAKARELLFYLLCHRGRTKEQIGLALWPDASPAQLRDNLHATLRHLRRALGRPEWILFEGGCYAFNRQLPYWFDVEAFESLLAQAKKLQAQAKAQAIQHLEQAVKRYQGDFLGDLLEGDWFLPRQRALRRMYLDAMLLLGSCFFAQQQYVQAADTYRQLLAHDSFQEAAHRELMRCYARQGERGQALRHYQALVDLMRDEFGSPPAPETTALVARLRQGEDI